MDRVGAAVVKARQQAVQPGKVGQFHRSGPFFCYRLMFCIGEAITRTRVLPLQAGPNGPAAMG
jgi:hypothetical protein